MGTRRVVAALALALTILLTVACAASGDHGSGPSPTAEPLLPTASPTAATPRSGEDDVVASYARRSLFVPLDNPKVVTADEATFLRKPGDRVLGVTMNGDSRAYPISMMTYHHITNDIVGGRPILVTF